VLALDWVTGDNKSYTADVITDILSKHEMFLDHYVPRFPSGKEIPSGYKLANIAKPRGPARSSHGFAAYLTGMCSQNVSIRGSNAKAFNMCTSKLVVGFKPDDIAVLKGNNATCTITIDLCIIVENNCTHLKHYNNTRLAGLARQRVIQNEGFTADGAFANPLPREMYKRYKKPRENGLSTEKVRNREGVYNLKKEMVKKLLHGHYGFVVGQDPALMFCHAIRQLAEKDEHNRLELASLINPEDPPPVDKRCLGILRKWEFDCNQPNRQSTPMTIAFGTASGLKLANKVFSTGRGIIHSDGSKSKVKWFMPEDEGDPRLIWEVRLSPAYRLAERDKRARSKLTPVTLFEVHTCCTSANDLSPVIKEFFDQMKGLCGSRERPILVEDQILYRSVSIMRRLGVRWDHIETISQRKDWI
jgi:hypothetical protein